MPKVSQSEEVGHGGCTGESRYQEYEVWELAEVWLVLVRGRNDPNYSVWKELLEEHHYLHSAKLYGQQIKYLVRSAEIGWIGAMSFSSSAWRVRVRDKRLGWDEEARKSGLRKVVSNSRFLIVPWLRVKNLASHVMSKALKRLGGDWEEAYKTTPVLVETYVEKGRYEGICYKASNWEYLGETQGRGRNDRYHQNRLSRKYVFAYELEEGILDAQTWARDPEEHGKKAKLLTNREVRDFEQACEKVQWYAVRFRIEVLKLIKYRGEYAANKGKSLSLRDAILIIAMLGGFVKGKGREPGVEVMWRGIRRLADILIGVSLTTNVHQSDYG